MERQTYCGTPTSSQNIGPWANTKIGRPLAAGDKIVADVPGGEAPDGGVYDPFSKHVFVADHNGGTVTEVDPVGGKSLAQIEVGKEGKLEFPASDGAGHLFVNIEEPGILGVIDVKAQKLTAKWKMAGCEDASGLAYTGRRPSCSSPPAAIRSPRWC